MAYMQAFQDGLQEVQAYLKTGVTPPGFSVMPISPEQVPDEAVAKMGKRPGSSKARDDLSGGPGISKDAGRPCNDVPAASTWSSWTIPISDAVKTPSLGMVCPFTVLQAGYLGSQDLTAYDKIDIVQLAVQARWLRPGGRKSRRRLQCGLQPCSASRER